MKKRIPWTEEDHNILSNCLNQGMTVEQINRDFLPNRSVDAIRTKMSRKNWKSPSKKWLLPFSIIMIPLAFIAGFIQADGSFSSSGGVDIGIARKDRHILEWACDQLQMPHSKISDIVKKSDSKSDKIYEASRLYLPKALGELFVQHFKLSPQKSKGQVVFPSFLNEYCLKAYLIGLFYGASSHSKGRGVSRIDFVSSYGFLEELLNYMQQNDVATHFTKENIKRKRTKTPGYDLAILRLHGKDAIDFFSFLAEPSIMQQLPNLERKIQDILTCPLPREKKR